MQIYPMRGHSRGEWYCSLDDVTPDAHEAEYWAVFGTTYRGITHCLGEFATKSGAEAAAYGLRRSRSVRAKPAPPALQTVPSVGWRDREPAHGGHRPKAFGDELAVPCYINLPARFVVRVETRSRDQARLDVAIVVDDQLHVAQALTPFEHEFVGKRLTALFCLKESDVEISAELWSDVYGEFMQIAAGGGGTTHKFVFSPNGPEYVFSGTAL